MSTDFENEVSVDSKETEADGPAPVIVWWSPDPNEAQMVVMMLSNSGIQAELTSQGYWRRLGYPSPTYRIGIMVRPWDENRARKALVAEYGDPDFEGELTREEHLHHPFAKRLVGGLSGISVVLVGLAAFGQTNPAVVFPTILVLAMAFLWILRLPVKPSNTQGPISGG